MTPTFSWLHIFSFSMHLYPTAFTTSACIESLAATNPHQPHKSLANHLLPWVVPYSVTGS